ncbi:unknown protein [Seminavis robusta]|uniref:BTB domain-containing protein n=1 Tax=Seminavis robusta TaxID=568900 RepID=A0A9N8ELK0_9STRA|nr:unknown protein [Seminavis robusta]|eukprot:Sro1316_g262110.1 n/a (264) ;mRNA; r:1363-2221
MRIENGHGVEVRHLSWTTSDKKVGGKKGGNHEGGTNKGEDWSDVVVVVGGVEFHESSHFLRAGSDYFEAAFRSGMKEAETKRFEFPDKDPEGWKLIKSFLEPFSNVSVSAKDAEKLLPWLDEFCMPKGLELCDQKPDTMAAERFREQPSSLSAEQREERNTVPALKYLLGNQCSIQPSTYEDYLLLLCPEGAGVEVVVSIRTKENMSVLFEAMQSDEHCCNEFWKLIQCHLPTSGSSSSDKVSILSLEHLPALVACEIQKKRS